MFTEVSHPLIGQELTYMPPGFSPFAPQRRDASLILAVGDPVTVLSAWSRPYLGDGAPILLYVRSHVSWQSTHVTENDLLNIGEGF